MFTVPPDILRGGRDSAHPIFSISPRIHRGINPPSLERHPMKSSYRLAACGFAILAALIATTRFTTNNGSHADEPAESRVFELRTYTTHPGKLPALHARFRDHTMKLFEKHGMKNVGYWTPTDEKLADNTLIYIVSHASRDAAKESWTGFINDPQWKAAYAQSIADGKLVDKIESVYMKPTDFSPLKK